MKPTVVFVRVPKKPEYLSGEIRWMESYLKNKPDIEHDVVIINNHGDGDPDFLPGATNLRYDGGGWDCGAWKFAAKNIPAEFLICFNSSTRIMYPDWMEKITKAAAENGDGIYGPLTSFEIVPHIRTPCMAFQPHVMAGYPREVLDREDTYRFESLGYPDGTPNVTQWARAKGFKTMLVARSGAYNLPEWRKPKNVFRDGDQSDLLIRDRHCDAYEISAPDGKAFLEKLANGR